MPNAIPPEVRVILLFDDVLAGGRTLAACIGAMRRDGWSGGIAAVVLGRAR